MQETLVKQAMGRNGHGLPASWRMAISLRCVHTPTDVHGQLARGIDGNFCVSLLHTPQLFAKKPSFNMTERLFLSAFGVYDNELNFYSVAKADSTFRDNEQIAALFPKPLVSWKKGKNFLLVYVKAWLHMFACVLGSLFLLCCRRMGDLGERNAEFASVIDAYPDRKVKSALRSFARMHAHFWDRVRCICLLRWDSMIP